MGINRVDGKIVGDVDFEGYKKWPVPSRPYRAAVGPVTIAMLMKNTVSSAAEN